MVDANQIKVAKYIIRQTPIGHLQETVDNLKIISEDDFFEQSEIQEELIAYEEEHLKQIPYNNGKIVISKETKDSEQYYIDQSKNIKIKVDPLNDAIVSSAPIDSNPSSLQKALDSFMQLYKTKYYKAGLTSTNIIEQSPDKYIILIAAHNKNTKNCWSGEWISTWELIKSGGSFKLTGLVKTNTYYHEEGNIQFHLDSTFTDSISSGDDNSVAKEVIEKIEANENNVQLDIDQVYDNFSEEYIKHLRRKLPVTGTKMNWNLNQILH